jgi:glycogen synthase
MDQSGKAMRILMLGWEFPPYIAGGLGVACYGLTRALDRLGHGVLFMLPRPLGSGTAPARGEPQGPARAAGGASQEVLRVESPEGIPAPVFRHVRFRAVPSTVTSPYPGGEAGGGGTPEGTSTAEFSPASAALGGEAGEGLVAIARLEPNGRGTGATGVAMVPVQRAGGTYSSDLMGDTDRYSRLVVSLARTEPFDVIHAHDWLTFPAGIALQRVTGRPLVVHVHSTEFDRSGEKVNQTLYDIERRGMHAADRVIAVSEYTRSICISRYGVAPSKVDVVYNGVENGEMQPPAGARIESQDKIVLFLGRITMQKGPEYFIAAAKRVLEKVENVKFVVAGSGDMARRMIELAAQMGIGHKVLFTGFLRGRDVQRVLQMADCYVMPSVSEPFGISALEALQHDVPVIISKQSGVSEVLSHVLKVDFWDTDEMANKIVAVLRHPPLSHALSTHGAFEVRGLTWDGAGEKCVRVYARAIEEHGRGAPAGAGR